MLVSLPSKRRQILDPLPFKGRVRVGMGFVPSHMNGQDVTHPRSATLEGEDCIFA
jgi:hypothetical protein